MKIVLIQTPWSEASAREFKGVAKRYALYPPLGLMYLAAAAEKAGHQAEVIDLEVRDFTLDELCQMITDMKVDIIGITGTSPVFHVVDKMAQELRQRLGKPIIVGGAHVNVLKEKAFYPSFDYMVVQEGEETLPELMTALENPKPNLSAIKGLIYREEGAVKINPPRDFIRDLDSIPFPSRHKLNHEDYFFEVPGKGVVPVGTIELTRGCPFKCVFCSEPLNTGRGLRKRSPKNVVDEMLEVKEKFGIDHFMTLDSTLTLNRKMIEAVCHELIERKANITWEGQTRANLVDAELLTLLKKSGLTRMSFGMESADPEVLRLMKKEVNPEDMRKAFRLCKEIGISTLCGTMMGNPGDTKESVLKTAWFVRSIPEVLYAPMAIAIPYPGTELAYMAENGMHGLKLLEKDYSKYSRYAGGVMSVNGMMPEELVKLQRRALFIIHSTPTKAWGLVRHFGLGPITQIAIQMIWKEIKSWFGAKEKVLVTSAIDNNTTVINLGLSPSDK